ncbi:MAG TPA: SigE family RNA polymerase sigma factor [Jatrophihabitans sp.]|nr:SigE family RNA polymerase sigma factor [Jatrophihabitans sp.]
MDGAAEFAMFVRQHSTTLLRAAYLLAGDRNAAEELLQDTLVRLYPQWRRVAEADVPLAYVRRSLTNNFLNSRRRHSSSDLLFGELPEQGYDPDLAGRISDRDLVRDLLDRLGPRQRAVVVLRFFHDLSDGEIASEVGCRQGTVRSIVSRSLQLLRTETERRARAGQTPQTNGHPR